MSYSQSDFTKNVYLIVRNLFKIPSSVAFKTKYILDNIQNKAKLRLLISHDYSVISSFTKLRPYTFYSFGTKPYQMIW